MRQLIVPQRILFPPDMSIMDTLGSLDQPRLSRPDNGVGRGVRIAVPKRGGLLLVLVRPDEETEDGHQDGELDCGLGLSSVEGTGSDPLDQLGSRGRPFRGVLFTSDHLVGYLDGFLHLLMTSHLDIDIYAGIARLGFLRRGLSSSPRRLGSGPRLCHIRYNPLDRTRRSDGGRGGDEIDELFDRARLLGRRGQAGFQGRCNGQGRGGFDRGIHGGGFGLHNRRIQTGRLSFSECLSILQHDQLLLALRNTKRE